MMKRTATTAAAARLAAGLLLASLMGTGLALAGTTPANAQRWSAGDPTRDVEGFQYDPQPEPCGTVTHPDARHNTTNDITRLSVEHRPDTVRAAVRFRDLLWKGFHLTEIGLHTEGRNYLVDVSRWRTGGKVDVALFHEPKLPEPDECGSQSYVMSELYCPALEGSLSPALDIVSVLVPRSCLKDPRWVRGSAYDYGFVGDTSFHDRWNPPGTPKSGPFGPYGPQVRRG
jgi:hypothetical protein